MKLAMPDDQRIMQMIEEYEQRSGRINHQKSKLKETELKKTKLKKKKI